MKKPNRITFLGAGNMAQALMRGLLENGIVTPAQIVACDPDQRMRDGCVERFGVTVETSNQNGVNGADVVFIAVKPHIVADVVSSVASDLATDAVLISIAAGRSIASIEDAAGDGVRVIRAMPNVCCLVGESATALSTGTRATDDDMALARVLFDSVGKTVVVEEKLIDSVTGLSGSGPAYVFIMIEALADAGVKMGISRESAQTLACQTLLGAAKLTAESGEHPGLLKDMVCSPGGTTIAGVHALEAGGLRNALINAVEASVKRARELAS